MIDTPSSEEEAPVNIAEDVEETPKARRRPRARKDDPAATEAPVVPQPVEAVEAVADEPSVKPKRKTRAKKAAPVESEQAPVEEEAVAAKPSAPAKPVPAPTASNDPVEDGDDDGEPRRGGWWNRTFG